MSATFPASGPIIHHLASLDPEVMAVALAELAEEDAQAIYLAERYCWENWARPEQVPPAGDWRICVLIAGRGGGKTRGGAEWFNVKAEENPGAHGGLLGATKADVRDVMVEDPESGILATAPPWFRPRYEPSKRRLTWPNGTTATTYSADEPEQSRGPNLGFGWADELAKYRQPGNVSGGGKNTVTAWDNFKLAVRVGLNPQILVTTTPRRVGRGAEIVKDLTLGPKVNGKRLITAPPGDPAEWWPRPDIVVRRWSMGRNRANLSRQFLAEIESSYVGTSLEAQEILGIIQDDVEGALWNLDQIEEHAVPGVPPLRRRLVVVDPSHEETGARDEAGIVVGGLGEDGDVYVMDDRSGQMSPVDWGKTAIAAYNEYAADAIGIEVTAVVTEKDERSKKKRHVVKDTIRLVDPDQKIKWIEIHSGVDKRTRAEPVATAYERGRVHHVRDPRHPNRLAALEDELASWDPTVKKSPNRLDTVVHLVTELLLKDQRAPLIAR